MKSLHFLSLWLVPAVLAWWGIRHSERDAAVAPACPAIICKDTVNIRLDDQCRLQLKPNMVLAGELDSACLATLQVEVFNAQQQSIGNTILAAYAGQLLTYQVTDPASGKTCWGHVRVEDKTPPTLVCPAPTDWIVNTAYANILPGIITNTDPQFRRSQFSCWLSAQTPAQGSYYYDTLRFQVPKDGIYTFLLVHDFLKSDIAAGAIFQGDFYKENPCQNILAFTENRSVVTNGYVLGDFWNNLPVVQQQIPWLNPQVPPFLRLELPLHKDQTYHLVTTSLQPEDTGNYAWVVLRDEVTQAPGTEILRGKTVVELPWITKLVCNDFERLKLPLNACYKTDAQGNITNISQDLRRVLQLTGFPHQGEKRFTRGASVQDNCGDITICVGDQVRQGYGTCDSTVIERTFAATDAKGNGTLCTQQIFIRKPTIQDVILPTYANYIECDEQFPVDSTGFASPKVTGYPLVRTAFGIKDLNTTFCNLGATYINKSRIDLCDKAYSFLREWTIVDWCNPGSTLIYTQLIKVGDFTPPRLDSLPKDPWDCIPTFSTGPFSCTASITIPTPDTIFDNCSGWNVSVDIISGFPEQTVAANKKPGDVVSNIPKGVHTFRYRLEDDCKNVAFREFLFEVLDLSVPAPVCNDLLHVSLAATSIGGSSRIFAKDLDEGSFDDCTDIALKARRSFADSACANAYSQLFFNKNFRQLFFKKDADLSPYGLFYHLKVDAYFTENPDPAVNPTAANAKPVFTLENNVLYSILNNHIDALCCDAQDSIRVELWVFDDANGNGTFGDTLQHFGYCRRTLRDNYNVCWLQVLIEDKSAPSCKPPLDLRVTCTDERIRYTSAFTCADSLLLDTLFGKFQAVDNCEARLVCDSVADERSSCGVGRIVRFYHAIDGFGNRSESCSQTITVTPVHNYEIKFPADISGECKILRDTLIQVRELACDLLAINVIDEVLSAGAGECFKVQRTFRVINWCEYDGISDPIIISRDEDCDGKPGDEDMYVLRRPGAGLELPAFTDRNNDETDRIPAAGTRGSTCDGNTNPAGYWRKVASTGYWQYTQILKVTDSEPPQIIAGPSVQCATGDSCSTDIALPFTVEEACSFETIRFEVVIDYFNDSVDFVNVQGPRIRGQYPKYRYEDTFPIGEHIVEIRIRDGCGNYNSIRLPIRVEDCKAPYPVCINGLAAELMTVRPAQDVNGDSIPDAGAVQIWAEDFIASPNEDCTGPVTYSISRLGEVANRNQTSLVLTCADAGNTVPVAIYAWDNAHNPRSVQPDGTPGGPNYAYCITYVLVQDNLLNCSGADTTRMPITGRISTEYAVPVPGVNVTLPSTPTLWTQTTSQGTYGLAAYKNNNDPLLKIIPELNNNFTEHISTLDIILITKHILGSQWLDSPYKMIAADINNSQSITTLDVIQLRKLILGIDVQFPKNTSWRFVDKHFKFPNPKEPWSTDFPETMTLHADTLRSKNDADFIAIKIGDVSAQPSTTQRHFSPQVVSLQTLDQILEPYQTYQVDFVANTADLAGYQFALQFEPQALELTDIRYGLAQEEHFGWRWLDQGLITTSWNGEIPNGSAQAQTLFSLTFRSKVAGHLQDYLSLAARPTLPEAYDNQNVIKEIQLSFQPYLTLHTPFTLYQNRPNPFSDVTTIGFYLPEAATARLQVFSADGKLLKTWNAYYAAGHHERPVSKSDLAGAGVYYYTLEVNGYKKTHKMLLH